MAKDDVNEELDDQDDQQEGKTKSGSNLKVIIIAVLAAVLLSGAVVGATLYFVTGSDLVKSAATEDGEEDEDEELAEEEESEPLGPAKYHSLNPKFVVSFRDQRSARFMQFEIDLLTRSDDTIMKIDEHMPAVRSSLLMLFDSLDYGVMSTSEGKKQLLIDVTTNVNETVDKMAGDSGEDSAVEAAYFTSFVIQ